MGLHHLAEDQEVAKQLCFRVHGETARELQQDLTRIDALLAAISNFHTVQKAGKQCFAAGSANQRRPVEPGSGCCAGRPQGPLRGFPGTLLGEDGEKAPV
eukprot:scaffold2008_cov283-Pinguiococcus_pyrenoidosus.AAC.10